MAYSSGDVLSAVVADIGQYSTKMGFAGEDYPKSYFRSNVAITRKDQNNDREIKKESNDKRIRSRRHPIDKIKYDYYTRPLNFPKENTDDGWEVVNPVNTTTGLWYSDVDRTNQDHDVDNQASSNKGNNNSSNNSNNSDSTEDGSADWYELIERFIQHGYDSALGTHIPGHPLLLVEKSYNLPPIRQQVLELLMEELNLPATFLARDATMACYATGRTTGTVVDIGYGGTTITPVFDGYVEQKGVRRNNTGSKVIDERVLQTIDKLTSQKGGTTPFKPIYQVHKFNKRSDALHQMARLDVARQVKECGAGATVPTSGLVGGSGNDQQYNIPHVSYDLPDGQTIDIPSAERFAIPNLLFSNDDDEAVKRRDELLKTIQNEYTTLISNASIVASNEDSTSDDNAGSSSKQQQQKGKGKYTEATAVGISSRRNKRSKRVAEAEKAAELKRKKELEDAQKSKKKTHFSNRELQRACVPYLQGLQEQLTSLPIANMVCDAAFRCDRDQQAQLLSNVILCGGGSCIGPTDQSMTDLLRDSVESIVHVHTPGWRVKVLSPNMQERSVCSWLGGSILASIGTFHDMWITKAEYDEWGSAIVNRKCP